MSRPAEVTSALLERMCVNSGLGRPLSVARRTGGELSSVYEVRFGHTTPAHSAIVKVYAPEWTWKQAKESYVYGLLRPAVPGAMPEILDVQPVDNPTGQAYTIMSLLPGRPLSELAPAFNDREAWEIYRQIGALTSALHQIGQPAFGYVVTEVIDPVADNISYVTRQFDKKLREFRDAGGDPKLARGAERMLSAALPSLAECTHAALCHNDLHEGNFLVERTDTGWSLAGVVDVENAVAADPLLDLAKTLCYSVGDSTAKGRGLAEGYGLDPVVVRQRLDLYRLYHTLELWDWFNQIGRSGPLPGLSIQVARILDAY